MKLHIFVKTTKRREESETSWRKIDGGLDFVCCEQIFFSSPHLPLAAAAAVLRYTYRRYDIRRAECNIQMWNWNNIGIKSRLPFIGSCFASYNILLVFFPQQLSAKVSKFVRHFFCCVVVCSALSLLETRRLIFSVYIWLWRCVETISAIFLVVFSSPIRRERGPCMC